MLSYSKTKGHDAGGVIMARELVGVAGFEPAASSSRTPPPREQGRWQPTYVQVTAVCAATLTASDPRVHESGRSRLAPKIGHSHVGISDLACMITALAAEDLNAATYRLGGRWLPGADLPVRRSAGL
jgi:hypothetical protein